MEGLDDWVRGKMIDDVSPFVTGETVWVRPNVERKSSFPTWWLLSTKEPGYLYNIGKLLLEETIKISKVSPSTTQKMDINKVFRKMWRALKKVVPDSLWKYYRYRSPVSINFKVFQVVNGDLIALNKEGDKYYLATKELGRDRKWKIRSDVAQRIIERSKMVREAIW